MDPLVTLLLSGGASVVTTALIVGGLHYAVPILSKMLGGIITTRSELDADRDKIIETQRAWNAALEVRLAKTEADLQAALAEVESLNHFIDTLVRRLGTTRERVERGGPLPRRRVD